MTLASGGTSPAPRREAGSAMNRLRGALCCGLLVMACCCSGALPESPNVVLIIGDDVGWTDFGFMGSDVVRTPHLDRLASEGIVFTHAFSPASLCRPALRSLLTGFEPYAVEIRMAAALRENKALLTLEEVFETLPERLGERGYVSFQGGKFWEGTFEMGGFTHGMTRTFSPSDMFVEDMSKISGSEGLALGRKTLQPLWDFLDAHSDRRFFVWYAPMLPHLPFDAPSRFRRAEIHARLGNKEKAIAMYEGFIELWKDCDPAFRPQVELAQARLEKLRSE